jgi:hypothetical protein
LPGKLIRSAPYNIWRIPGHPISRRTFVTKVKVVGHDEGHSKRRAEVELEVNVGPEIAADQPRVRMAYDALKKRYQVVKIHVEGSGSE